MSNHLLRVDGHEWAQRLLQASVLSGRSSHAYLFTGPDQVGKTTLALAFAQALTCTSPQPGPGLGACGRCRACRLAAEGGHPDHRLVEAQGGQLKIEQVRDLIREAALSPIEGRYKIFILPGFDRANANAANALLKTLEEPTDSTRLLLTSSQAAGLLPTITSRCQTLNLRPLPATVIAAALQAGWGAAPAQADLLAGLSAGRPGWAVQMLTRPDAWAKQQQRLSDGQALARQSRVERLAYAARLADADDLETTLRSWLLWWRDVLFVQQGCGQLIVHREQEQLVRAAAGASQPGDVRRFLAALMTTAAYLRLNVNMQLAIENLLLKAPSMA
jgi:DNA polymerase-3 subunit delta'